MSTAELRNLPSIDRLLQAEVVVQARQQFGQELTLQTARELLEAVRSDIIATDATCPSLPELALTLVEQLQLLSRPTLRPVINATGPQTRFSSTRSVLLQNLIRRGLIMPDDMDMGVRVDSDHTVITPDGARSDVLLALGPLLRGSLWETIAEPELRGQAMRVAQTLLDQTPEAATEPAAVMMEYMI